jgi:hypothetical protein
MKKLPLWICLLILSVGLIGCGPKATPEADMTMDEVFTAVAQTITAQYTPPTVTFTPTVTPTATVTLTPTQALPTATAGSVVNVAPTAAFGTTCDNAVYVSDVTIPDGTTVQAGKEFTKTWRIQNTGTCTWSTSYRLAHTSGDKLDGVVTYLKNSVGTGDSVDVSVVLKAPTGAGSYISYWRMQNASGTPFGVYLYVQIAVSTNGTITATVTGTPGSTSTVTATGTITMTPTITQTPTETEVPSPTP